MLLLSPMFFVIKRVSVLIKLFILLLILPEPLVAQCPPNNEISCQISAPTITSDQSICINEFPLSLYGDGTNGSTQVSGLNALMTIIQENEDGFCGVDGSIDSDHSGYTGQGFANTDNSNRNGIDYELNLLQGSYEIEIRYALGSNASRSADVIVNNVSSTIIDFTSTGQWTNWNTITTNVTFSGGNTSIRIEANQGQGLPNVDYIKLTKISAVSYQWESSTLSLTSGFSPIIGATSENYAPPSLSQTTYYRLITSIDKSRAYINITQHFFNANI